MLALSSYSSTLLQTRSVHRSAFVFLFLLCFAIYGNWLIRITPPAYSAIWRLTGPLLLLTDFLNPVYGPLWRYFGWLIIGIGFAFAILIAGRPSFWQTVFYSLAILLLVCAPYWLQTMYGSYQLYAEAANGYELQWVTEPEDTFLSAFKSAQRIHEKDGCNYRLLGWSSDNQLYYQSNWERSTRQYDAQTQMRTDTVGTKSAIVATTAENIFGADTALDIEGIAGETNFFAAYAHAISPDTHFAAYLIKNYYGPCDVIIVSQSNVQ